MHTHSIISEWISYCTTYIYSNLLRTYIYIAMMKEILNDAPRRDHLEMDSEEEEAAFRAVSPMGHYLNSSILSVSIIAVMETEIPIDDSTTATALQRLFLHLNPRFTSIMVGEKNGEKKWKTVKVNLQNHIIIPKFPKMEDPPPHFYDDHLNNYLSNIAASGFQQDKPLWEVHLVKYPTTTSAGQIIFKLHHSLGDGYSLMGALLSCLKRVDNPSLPLTLPTLKPSLKSKKHGGFLRIVPKVFSGLFNTFSDFGWDVLKSSILTDDISPVRSGVDAVEFNPVVLTSVTFSLDRIKEIKTKLKVTINDVITGVVFYGFRLYMEEKGFKNRKSHLTALTLLNTRNMEAYQSITEMVNPDSKSLWGNNFALLNVVVPEFTHQNISNPLNFVYEAHNLIKRKKTSAAVYLTGQLFEVIRKCRGPEAAAKYLYSSLQNSSITISNLIGPVDPVALEGHPLKSIYYYVHGCPQSIMTMMMSYAGMLRIGLTLEKDFIEPNKLKSCIQNAFEIIFQVSH